MKLQKRQRQLADAVLSYFESISDTIDTENVECRVNPYINGREYGYVIELSYVDGMCIFSKNALWVAFSENRNSDDIVVYTDETVWDGEITEKSYDNKEMFDFSKAYDAAEYIYKLIENKVNVMRSTIVTNS